MGVYIPDIFLNGRCQNCPWSRVFDNAHYACDRYPWIGRFPMTDGIPKECRIKEVSVPANDLISKQEVFEYIEGWLKMDEYYHPDAEQRNIPVDEVKDIIERVPGII